MNNSEAIGHSYQMLLKEFGYITLMPRDEMLALTDLPARLRLEV